MGFEGGDAGEEAGFLELMRLNEPLLLIDQLINHIVFLIDPVFDPGLLLSHEFLEHPILFC